MDSAYEIKNENPVIKASLISRIFFCWMLKTCRKFLKGEFKVADLYKVLERDKSTPLANILQNNWDEEVFLAKKLNKSPSLLKTLLKTYMRKHLYNAILLGFQALVLRVVQPVIVYRIIELFEEVPKENSTELYGMVALLVVTQVLSMILVREAEIYEKQLGMNIRTALSSMMYRKVLKLNQKSLNKTAIGKLLNMFSGDVEKFDLILLYSNYIWVIPLQFSLITILLWNKVGVSCIPGLVTIILLTVPAQVSLFRVSANTTSRESQKSDTRIKLMNEIVTGIQVIKMYAWELPFEKYMNKIRQEEVDLLKRNYYLKSVFNSVQTSGERISKFVLLLWLYFNGTLISAKLIFSISCFMNVLNLSLVIYFPLTLMLTAEILSSIKRIQNLLLLKESEKSSIEYDNSGDIEINNVNATWVSGYPTLQNINLKINSGNLCIIIGSVGSGKSSLLQLLLGELSCSSGKLRIGGQIAYASQDPWIFSSSARQNILFGHAYDTNRYKDVVNVCSLEPDFYQFANSDQTLVGERGISISGGQKARINLARAVYQEADIYLFDDPLSAVDAEVGAQLFDNCISNYLKNKTRILVTHQIQFVKKADIIVVVDKGKIEAYGTFSELSKSNLNFKKFLVEDSNAIKEDKIQNNSVNLSSQICKAQEEKIVYLKSPLMEYLKSSNSIILILSTTIVILVTQILMSGSDYWIAYWTNEEYLRNISSTETSFSISWQTTNQTRYTEESVPPVTNNNTIYDFVVVNGELQKLLKSNITIYIYSLFIVGLFILGFLRPIVSYKLALKCSKNIHQKLFKSVMQAPIRFFHINSMGTIMSKFSQDMGIIDKLLPRNLIEYYRIMLLLIGAVVNVVFSNYYLILSCVISGVVFVTLQSWTTKVSKCFKHIVGVVKSPVLSHVSATLRGITTIRSSKMEKVLIEQFEDHLDNHNSACYLTIVCTAMSGLYLDFVSAGFLIINCISFLLLYYFDFPINGSMLGLAISQTLILSGTVQFGLKQKAESVFSLTSVERVLQYTQLESEKTLMKLESNEEISEKSIVKGQIQFLHVFLRYSRNDPYVLTNINFNILPGEKIGVVGRTGAGKSSLIAALFRLIPLEGSIIIDDIDTRHIPLCKLRSSISIIPQEPILFSASIRFNMDPFNQYEDTLVWNAVEDVGLKSAIPGLDFIVQEGGSNFSVGQRQLICLARAILRNNPILVLDEATSNVDPETDTLIQTTIRDKFKHCTLITIAHRLNTIMDSDKVLVMDKGCMVEFEHPHLLLENTESYFHHLVSETGPGMSLHLKNIAFESYHHK